MVTNARKVFHTTATNENNGVFLKIVSFTGNICGNFITRSQTDTSHFAKSRVRLLRCHRLYNETNTTTLRASLKRGRFRMLSKRSTSLAN
jgi:hypothetical protein